MVYGGHGGQYGVWGAWWSIWCMGHGGQYGVWGMVVNMVVNMGGQYGGQYGWSIWGMVVRLSRTYCYALPKTTQPMENLTCSPHMHTVQMRVMIEGLKHLLLYRDHLSDSFIVRGIVLYNTLTTMNTLCFKTTTF